MNRKITTSIIAQAKVMKQNGKTLKEIAAELGVNKYTIQFYLKDVPSPNNKRLTDEQKEKIVALTKKWFKYIPDSRQTRNKSKNGMPHFEKIFSQRKRA